MVSWLSWSRWAAPVGSAAVLGLMVATLPQLGAISRAIAVACVLASFAAAAALKRRDVRAHASAVMGIAAVVAAGQTAGGPVYGVVAGAYIMVCLGALRAARRVESVPVRPRAILITFGTTAAVITASVLTLPPLAARIEHYVTGAFAIEGEEATAFSTHMILGSTRGMLQSDAIVARIDGESPQYLRGAVYDKYDGRAWNTMGGRERRPVLASVAASTTSQMTLDRHAPNGADMRWFLPPGACGFDLTVDVDTFGIARRGPGPVPAHLGYATKGCTPPPVLPPTGQDLEVMPSIRPVVAAQALAWAGAATTDRERLKALENGLSRFDYSLAVERNEHIDPIVDFLTLHRAGHCEMFASAMVLAARTLNIPARVVGGFRVTEINPLTHQSIVRDRNAHAWVEAWVDGAWHAYDPTPLSDRPGARAGFFDHAGDLWALAIDRVAQMSPLGIVATLLAIVAVLLALRSATSWIRRPRKRRAAVAMERPLPCFDTLTSALAAAGFTRDPSEPLEAFAERVPAEAASALAAYAALRYGNIGLERDVAAAVERAAKMVSAVRTPTAAS